MRAAGAVVLLVVGCGGSPFAAGGNGGSAGTSSSAGRGGDAQSSGGSSSSSGTGGSVTEPSAGEGGEAPAVGTGGAAAGGAGGASPVLSKCTRSGWTASAFAEEPKDAYGGPAAMVLDGDDMTRWSAGVPQAVGQWLQLDGVVKVAALEVRETEFPLDVPAHVGLELDGVAAGTVQTTPSAGVLRLTAPGIEHAKAIRLVLQEASSGTSWWSIGEIDGTCAR